MVLAVALVLFLVVAPPSVPSAFFVSAVKDDSYYSANSGNPNMDLPMYWKDSENVLQDLSQFSSLYVEFHSCVWSWMKFRSAYVDDGNSGSGDYANDWHNPLRRQFVINLDASVEITASDGECRTIGIGEVLLLEDLHGKGHAGKAVDGKFRHSVLISIDDNSRFGRMVR